MMVGTDCKNNFQSISPFLEEICKEIKKEIKQEFVQKGLFRGREDCQDWKGIVCFFYQKMIEEQDEKIRQWVAAAWVSRNGDIFQLFHEELSKLSKDYDTLQAFPAPFEKQLQLLSLKEFGALRTYLFSFFNEVVFSKETFAELYSQALEEVSLKKESIEQKAEFSEEMKNKMEEQLSKINEKFERKLQGILKKHQIEVDGYRKQVGQLQKKLESFRV
jgi:polyhydroxyalkanoate synthesis regulator phasin